MAKHRSLLSNAAYSSAKSMLRKRQRVTLFFTGAVVFARRHPKAQQK
jgi:hypothetical protein